MGRVRCDFINCQFPAGTYSADKSYDVESYLLDTAGDGPEKSWQNDPAKAGRIMLKRSAAPHFRTETSPWMRAFFQDDPAAGWLDAASNARSDR
jgi:hypothetical protein